MRNYQGWPGNATKTIVITYAMAHPNTTPQEIATWFEFSYDTVRRALQRAGLRTHFRRCGRDRERRNASQRAWRQRRKLEIN